MWHLKVEDFDTATEPYDKRLRAVSRYACRYVRGVAQAVSHIMTFHLFSYLVSVSLKFWTSKSRFRPNLLASLPPRVDVETHPSDGESKDNVTHNEGGREGGENYSWSVSLSKQ